jgi:hypothetical protein
MIDTYFAESEKGVNYKKDWLMDIDLANACVYIASQPAYVRIVEIRMHPMTQGTLPARSCLHWIALVQHCNLTRS